MRFFPVMVFAEKSKYTEARQEKSALHLPILKAFMRFWILFKVVNLHSFQSPNNYPKEYYFNG